MDKLDQLLTEAWYRIGAKVRADRVQALKRSRRRFKGVLRRPMREWCLVIRASDTRINPGTCAIELPDEDQGGIGHGFNSTDQAFAAGHPHIVTLDGELIRRLTQPVTIPFPGVTYEEAARLLGREYKTMKTWARRGMFRIDYYREKGFKEYTTRSRPIDLLGETSRGGRPYVWTPSPIDPNAATGRTPHAIFGTLWQWLWQNLPEDYTLTVRREPRRHICRRRKVFRGWEFICPGRLDARGQNSGQHSGCGRRCTHLFAPQTVWTLARAMDDGQGEGFDMPEEGEDLPRLSGQWFPGLGDTVAQPGMRSFACRRCWRVRNTCFADGSGWNEFIAHISGGLLYASEVPRPLDVCPMVRKMPAYVRKRRRLQAKADGALRSEDMTTALVAAAAEALRSSTLQVAEGGPSCVSPSPIPRSATLSRRSST